MKKSCLYVELTKNLQMTHLITSANTILTLYSVFCTSQIRESETTQKHWKHILLSSEDHKTLMVAWNSNDNKWIIIDVLVSNWSHNIPSLIKIDDITCGLTYLFNGRYISLEGITLWVPHVTIYPNLTKDPSIVSKNTPMVQIWARLDDKKMIFP